jgi:xanthine dehydrogenase accessory factor
VQAIDALAEARKQGRRVALVTVLAVEGDAPSHPGAKLLADHTGPIAGTLGCSEFDTAGLELARQALDGLRTVRQRLDFARHGEQRAIELFAEVQEPDPGVIVVGGNPVGRAIAAVAVATGRRVKLITPTIDVAEPAGVQVAVGDPTAIVDAHGLTAADAIVLSDHDAPWVDDVLRIALESPTGFVGMLGSRRHAPQAVQRLREAGIDEKQLARLHSPCGLDIGSRTAGEIALSIMAEIVASERGRSGGSMSIDWSQN